MKFKLMIMLCGVTATISTPDDEMFIGMALGTSIQAAATVCFSVSVTATSTSYFTAPAARALGFVGVIIFANAIVINTFKFWYCGTTCEVTA